jgi:hypothetical protein
MTTPPALAQDLAFTSFPFNAQLTDDHEEPKDTGGGGFRGFFNKLFSDGSQPVASGGTPVPVITEEPSTSVNEDETRKYFRHFILYLLTLNFSTLRPNRKSRIRPVKSAKKDFRSSYAVDPNKQWRTEVDGLQPEHFSQLLDAGFNRKRVL